MSYILDALRKSEKERALANIPTLKSVGHNEEKGIPLSWLVLAATLTVFVAALSGLWFGIGSSQPISAIQEKLEEKPVAHDTEGARPIAEKHDQSKPIAKTEQPIGLAETTLDPVPLSDLDSSIQSRLPDLAINALSYSPHPEKRFVMVNQEIVKEGEDLGNGLVVEEIKKSSVVLSFEGHLFILRPF